ncbi:hypothetical protein [Streptomyces anulatus]|uniref:hypothetical protein n=1 Tax=Streptomyces anulatus TaxID=1892 RepID=UPI0036BDB088
MPYRGNVSAVHRALALSWTGCWPDTALDYAPRTHPDAGGAPVPHRSPPDGYTAEPRLDILRPDQAVTTPSVVTVLRNHHGKKVREEQRVRP